MDLLKINVNDHTEKKNGLTYLSWAWAWAEVLKADPLADWEAVEYPQPDGTLAPCMYLGNGTAMVKTKVTIKGKTRVCGLPVMDHRNKAIKDPDAFAVNTAVMRCMTKAISMHGLGLYIYAGEDLPETDKPDDDPARKVQSIAPAQLVAEEAAQFISAERKDDLAEDALKIVTAFRANRSEEIMPIYDSVQNNEELAYLWDLLSKESRVRSFIKKQIELAA